MSDDLLTDDELEKEMVFAAIAVSVVIGILLGSIAIVGVLVFGGS